MYSKLEYFGKAIDATIIKLSDGSIIHGDGNSLNEVHKTIEDGGTLTINLKDGRQHMFSGAHIVHASYYPGKAQNNA